MTKRIFILLFSLAGFFLMPSVAVACSMAPGSDASCCQTTASEHTSAAVDTHTGFLQKAQAAGSCGDKGSHSACQCPTGNMTVALPFTEAEIGLVPGLSENISLFIESGIASGFHSIWLPPKIA